MGDFVFIIAISAFFVLCILYDTVHKIRFEKRELARIKGIYPGKPSQIKTERIEHLDGYLAKHYPDKDIDVITWNDLGMDSIFESMNYTHSGTGEEYLYYLLHKNDLTREELEHFETLVDHFSKDPDKRAYFEVLFEELGHTDKYSIYEYIDTLQELGRRSNLKELLVDGILVAGLVMIPWFTTPGILISVGAALYNIISYFSVKSKLEPYIISFIYILRLLRISEKITKADASFLKEEQANILEYSSRIKAIKFGNGIALSIGRVSTTGNPLEVLWDYIKMAFHFDLIFFNRMYHMVEANQDNIDRINSQLGLIESAIAICTYRFAHEGKWCVPAILENGNGIHIHGGLHPELPDGVPNSITTNNSILITGSNASGKSTFLKMIALNCLLAQSIHTCFAKGFEAPLYRIFSSMSLRDSLGDGESYFIVEIKAIRRVIEEQKNSDRPVICFVDEILRGTNTTERIAASSQILKSLHEEKVLCFTATHDLELTYLLDKVYDNYHFKEEMTEEDIYFPFQLLEGRADTRNAIKLLKITGFHQSIIEAANQMVSDFESSGNWTLA